MFSCRLTAERLLHCRAFCARLAEVAHRCGDVLHVNGCCSLCAIKTCGFEGIEVFKADVILGYQSEADARMATTASRTLHNVAGLLYSEAALIASRGCIHFEKGDACGASSFGFLGACFAGRAQFAFLRSSACFVFSFFLLFIFFLFFLQVLNCSWWFPAYRTTDKLQKWPFMFVVFVCPAVDR